MKAWHFTGNELRDGSPIPKVGEWLVYEGDIVICESGLHASKDMFDALLYAPGPILHRVECEDIVTEHDDKFVCRRRKIIASLNATEGLHYFARMQALSVVHLWDAPDVALDYLMTGDESIRAATGDAARAAAWGAAREVARAVDAGKEARAATYAAARDAARLASVAATRDAAWAARDAALAATGKAAWAARDVVYAAARDAARKDWTQLVSEAFGEDK